MSQFDDLERLFDGIAQDAAVQNYVELGGAKHVLVPSREKKREVDADPAKTIDPFWREDPIPLEEFVVSPDHMAQPPLSPRQAKDLGEFLGIDPKRIFLSPETKWREAVLLWGKGSGKDWVSSLVQAWIIYILLCMRNPRAVLKMPAGESTDIVNVAYAKDQAEDVFFSKFTGRLLNWKWLSDRYLIINSGVVRNRDRHPNLSYKKAEGDDSVINIASDLVEFPFGIRAHSKHSQNESWEGLNILFAVMDEASAFRDKGKKANANAVHGTLRSSAQRFPGLFRIMILSWPRKKRGDFTIRKYEDAVEGRSTDVYASKAAVWEVNPKAKKEHYAEEYRTDPESAAAKYECNPPSSDVAFFNEANVGLCFVEGMTSSVHSELGVARLKVESPTGETIWRNYVGRKIAEVIVRGLEDRSRPRVIALDGGATSDRGAMMIAHGVPEEIWVDPGDGSEPKRHIVNKVVVDAALLWTPDKENNLQVSLANMADFVAELKSFWNIRAVAYDHWQSYTSIETLTAAGIYCEAHNVNADDYGTLKEMVNIHKVLIPTDEWSDWETLRVEMEDLERRLTPTGDFRVDHPDDGSKDLADTLAQVTRMLNDPTIRKVAQERTMPRLGLAPAMSAGGGHSISAARPASLHGGGLTGGAGTGTFESVVNSLRSGQGRSGYSQTPEPTGVQIPNTPGGKAQAPFPRITRVTLR